MREMSQHQEQAMGSHTALLSILLANVQSFQNKLDNLKVHVKFQRDIWDCSLLNKNWHFSLYVLWLTQPFFFKLFLGFTVYDAGYRH